MTTTATLSYECGDDAATLTFTNGGPTEVHASAGTHGDTTVPANGSATLPIDLYNGKIRLGPVVVDGQTQRVTFRDAPTTTNVVGDVDPACPPVMPTQLAFTGAHTEILGSIGIALVAIGIAVRRFARRCVLVSSPESLSPKKSPE